MLNLGLLGRALTTMCQGAAWTSNGDTYADIVWLDQHQTKPTQAALGTAILNQLTILGASNALLAYAALRQASVVVGGLQVNVGTTQTPQNVEASTDSYSLALLNGAASIAAAVPSQTFPWVPTTGSPLTLTAAQMTTIFQTVGAFIQATFTTQAALIAAINAGTVTTVAQIDHPPSPIPAWPVNS